MPLEPSDLADPKILEVSEVGKTMVLMGEWQGRSFGFWKEALPSTAEKSMLFGKQPLSRSWVLLVMNV